MSLMMSHLLPSTLDHGTTVLYHSSACSLEVFNLHPISDKIALTVLHQPLLDDRKQHRVQHSEISICRFWLKTSPQSGFWEKVGLESSNWSGPGEMDRYMFFHTEDSWLGMRDSAP
jgi:hypothetical protein